MRVKGYKLCGTGPWGILDRSGAIVYDLIDDHKEAKAICLLLNRGVGPDWDEVEESLKKAVAL